MAQIPPTSVYASQWSLDLGMSNTPLSFRDEQLEELNTRSMPWFIARSMNMRANISQAGGPAEARIKRSTASCQWGRSCWALGAVSECSGRHLPA
jgi:hypothetical protein